MPGRDGLFLHEELMLLALLDEKGTLASGTWYSYALGGGILVELMLAERIRVVSPKKNRQLVELASSQRMGDPVIDECLRKVRDAKRRESVGTWFSRFSRTKNLHHRVAERLSQRGILRVGKDKILGIFSRRVYPEIDPGPEKRIIDRLRRAIFTAGGDVDPRTVALVSLAYHTGLLNVVFGRKKVKASKSRIEKIMNGDMTAKAAKEAVEAARAAVMVACILPAIMTTTVIHS